MPKQTKTARILRLLEQGKKASEIAKIVDCWPTYVSVVRRRAAHPEKFLAYQRAYQRRRYQEDPEYRAKRIKNVTDWQDKNPGYWRR